MGRRAVTLLEGRRYKVFFRKVQGIASSTRMLVDPSSWFTRRQMRVFSLPPAGHLDPGCPPPPPPIPFQGSYFQPWPPAAWARAVSKPPSWLSCTVQAQPREGSLASYFSTSCRDLDLTSSCQHYPPGRISLAHPSSTGPVPTATAAAPIKPTMPLSSPSPTR